MIEPYLTAALIWTLSGGSLDRETERWLLWELPFHRALQYYHCAARAADRATVRPGSPVQATDAAAAGVRTRALAVDAQLAEEVLV